MSDAYNQLNAIAAEFDQAAYSTIPRAVALLQIEGDELGRIARDLCPRGETGELADSIWATVDPVRLSVEVGPWAFYGHFVEFGTSKMAPKPYMGPAADQREQAFLDAVAAMGAEILA